MPPLRPLAALAVLLALGTLAGCAAPVVEAASVAADRAIYNNNLVEARAGVAQAQYRVGDALCCSVSSSQPFYNTQQSTEWLCLAAAQGHKDAMHRLGRIYSGDTVDGVRLARRAAAALADDPTYPAAAYAWFRFAAEAGDTDGMAKAERVASRMTPQQAARAQELLASGRAAAPCTMQQVTLRG